MKRTALSFIMLLALSLNVNISLANSCLLVETNVNDIISNSQFIFEGLVVEKTPFWSEDFNTILTANKIIVSQGFNNSDIVFIITKGGKVGDTSMHFNPSLNLKLGDTGLFMVNYSLETNNDLNNTYQFVCTKDVQGFYKIENEKAIGILKSLQYQDLIKEINLKKKTTLKFNNNSQNQLNNKVLMPVINSFSPTTIAAGDFQELTINGTGFGSNTGSAAVLMQNNGSTNINDLITVPATNITFWSDNQIRLIVPGNNVENNDRGAGTGNIRVRNSNAQTTTSSNVLIVNIHKNVSGNSEIDVPSTDNNGFVDIYVSNNVINVGALPAIERAILEWNCNTNINFRYAGPSNLTCNTNDGINLISFDNNCTINSLASTRTTTSKCSNEEAFLIDADIIFSTNTNWNYGPGPTQSTQYDFESTILHELGHLHQLGHVLNIGDLMYPLLQTGTDLRNITPDALQGGLEVTSTSVIANNCGPNPIDIYNSSACSNATPFPNIDVNFNSICIDENVSFTDVSLNNPTNWFWTFEGGIPNTSTLQNPVVNYPTEGTFNVTLTVGNANGSNTTTFENYIETDSDCCPSPINFMANDITESNANISWQNVASAEDYIVRIRSLNNPTWTTFTTTINFGFLSGLSACTTYEVQIATLCPLIGSAGVVYGGSFFFTTDGCVGCGFPPQSFAFNTTSISTLLTWDIVSQAESYSVRYRRMNNQNWFYYNSQFPLAILFGLMPCTDYEFQVQSICANESSTYSNSFTLQTLCGRIEADLIDEIDVQVYPNPAQNFIELNISSITEGSQIEIFDLLGKVLIKKDANQNFETINIQDLEAGQYFVRIKQNNNYSATFPITKLK